MHRYKRRMPVVLVNGLAEQSESWFANRAVLSRHFDLKVPEILVYDGDALHRGSSPAARSRSNISLIVSARFLDEFVQRSPCHLVASSLGCQVALTVAVRRPESVSKLVLICPSGFHGRRELAGDRRRRRSDHDSLVASVFYRGRLPASELVADDAPEVPGSQMEEGRSADAARHGRPFGGAAAAAGVAERSGDLGRRGSRALRRTRARSAPASESAAFARS